MIAVLEDFVLLDNLQKPLLVPIPITRRRKWMRGYNQSELLAHEITVKDSTGSLEFAPHILKKIRHTKPQTTIKERAERLRNIEGCFATQNPERIRKRDIVLIDDIYTTGATLREAAKILKSSGARKIIAFTVAH